MKIILHIGQSKTGTSSIQAYLTANRRRLMARGVLYPSPRVRGLALDLGSHNFLADSLLGKQRYPFLRDEQYFSQFFAEAEKIRANLMILSAEHFWGGEPRLWQHRLDEYRALYERKLERLGEFLQGHDVTVLVYLRPQLDWFASYCTQNITYGRIAGKRSLGDDRYNYEMLKPLLKYSTRLELWERIVRPNRLLAVPYVRQELRDRDSVSDFLFRAGIEEISESGGRKYVEANKTLSREFIAVKKKLNEIRRSNIEEHVVVRCLKKLSKDSEMGSGYRVDDIVAKELEAYVAEDNRLVSERYLPKGTSFSARGSYAGESLQPLSEAEIAAAMEKFEREYGRLSTRVLARNIELLAWLRKNARFAHGFLHQAKRLRRQFVK